MHWLRAAGLAGSLLVFSWPTIAPAGSRFALSFPVVTLVFIGALLALTLGWTHTPGPDAVTGRGTSTGFAWLVGGTASALFALGLGTMLQTVLNTPITPLRADMLPVIEMAIRRLATGHDPYGMYEMPWLVPLPYGPVMWVPFTIPVALGIDMRAVTLVGVLFVPAWCAIAATVDASRRRWSSAIGWLIVLAAIVLNPDLRRFSTIGHSPAYWPLILPFAALVRRERWLGAAALLALLLVGRSTTIAIVPVFFMTVWIRAPQALTRALLVWAAVVAVLIVPFFLWDPPAMWYGMVASYPRIMKQSVWVHFPQWVTDTIGLTGWLLARHRAVLVEASQMIAMAAVWAASWGAIRRGRAPLPWMACSLAVFCMTSLWPVYYIYFDALLLFVCAALVETPVPGVPLLSTPRRAATAWSATIGALVTALAVALFSVADAYPTTSTATTMDSKTSVALPRRSRSAAVITVIGTINTTPAAMSARLNGTPLQIVPVSVGAMALMLDAPADLWRIGSNELTIDAAAPNLQIRSVSVGAPPSRR